MSAATPTVSLAYHGQISAANVADTVTVSFDSAAETVEVCNRDGSAELFFTVGTPTNPPPPAVAGHADTYIVPATITAREVSLGVGVTAVVVSVVSAGTPKYSVTAGPTLQLDPGEAA